MRIAVVNHRYAPFAGGSEQYAQEVAEAYARRGHIVHVITSNAFDLEYFWDPQRRPVEAAWREEVNGVTITRVPVRHYPCSSVVFRGGHRLLGEASRVARWAPPYRLVARMLPWLPTLSAALTDIGPLDVVLATNLGLEGPALTALRVARRQQAAFVLAPFVHLGAGDHAIARRYVTMPHQLALLREANAVIAMTQREADFLTSVGVAEQRIVVAGAGFHPAHVTGGDASAFRSRYELRGPLVGALGALAPEKGSIDLVRAVQQLRRAGKAVELVLAGPALSAFERWHERLSAAERAGVHVLGVIDAATRRDMLSALDVLALPSRTESFGIVFPEAWANGKPVVGADAGAIPDLVQDGVNGLLTRFGDVAGLAEALRRLLTDQGLAQRLGAAGQQLALTRYTWPSVLRRVHQAFEIALGYPLPLEET
jgi:glycosyltransferase involved in cell wall biosynthesis